MMKLSDGEKLILYMLAEMYEKLKVNGNVDPKLVSSAIWAHQLWAIRWEYDWLGFEHSEDPPAVGEVVDILEMWDFIEDDYERMSSEERKQLGNESMSFAGFDSKHESEHHSVAKFLIQDLERFPRFKERSLKCHNPSLDRHRRMLSVFNPIRPSLDGVSLNVEQMRQIFLAAER